ncbi:MAG: hypothetical protein WKF40_05180 [Thermoleophilaceae bacterium]
MEADPAARAARNQPRGVGPSDLLDPQDILIAFSDPGSRRYGRRSALREDDDDGNGFVDDMVGWDFLDNDNDPYDDVQYGHGTGEARDSTAEANNRIDDKNATELASARTAWRFHMRVGDSFVADVNNFAQAVIYATDNDVLVVQSALGTLNNSNLARDAVELRLRPRGHGGRLGRRRGGPAQQPAVSLPHTILVNSVTKYNETPHPGLALVPAVQRLHELQLEDHRGDPQRQLLLRRRRPGVGDGRNHRELRRSTRRSAACSSLIRAVVRTNGRRCAITPNEVRQLMASGQVDGQTQADDVDFSNTELACSRARLHRSVPVCTARSPAHVVLAPGQHPKLSGPRAATTSSTATGG